MYKVDSYCVQKHISKESYLDISGLIPESIVDGIGLRFTIFVQGCDKNCLNCHNPQTHKYNIGIKMSILEILNEIQKSSLVTGVTFSGGEPFDQVEQLDILARMLIDAGYNVMSYTGYTIDELLTSKYNRQNISLLSKLDYLVDGRYMEELKTLNIPFLGSKNQRYMNKKEVTEYITGKYFVVLDK